MDELDNLNQRLKEHLQDGVGTSEMITTASVHDCKSLLEAAVANIDAAGMEESMVHMEDVPFEEDTTIGNEVQWSLLEVSNSFASAAADDPAATYSNTGEPEKAAPVSLPSPPPIPTRISVDRSVCVDEPDNMQGGEQAVNVSHCGTSVNNSDMIAVSDDSSENYCAANDEDEDEGDAECLANSSCSSDSKRGMMMRLDVRAQRIAAIMKSTSNYAKD